jgi:hypothetical protein
MGLPSRKFHRQITSRFEFFTAGGMHINALSTGSNLKVYIPIEIKGDRPTTNLCSANYAALLLHPKERLVMDC